MDIPFLYAPGGMQVTRYSTDDEHEEGIYMEIMVDACGPEEQAKGEPIL